MEGPAEHYLFNGNTSSRLPEDLSFAFDINDAGAVVGIRNDGRPAIYQDGTVPPLSLQRGQGDALGEQLRDVLDEDLRATLSDMHERLRAGLDQPPPAAPAPQPRRRAVP